MNNRATSTSRAPAAAAATRFGRGNRRRRGVAMVVVLMSTVLLAGLVFYVFNLGRHTNDRIITQHSADAAAMAGSGWVARTFNTVAMNNVAMVRLLALAQFAAPQAVEFTLLDQQSLHEAITGQMDRGISHRWVREALEAMADEVDAEVQSLEPMNDVFNVPDSPSYFDVRRMTTYDGPDGRGQIWQAIESLDAFSETAVETMGVLAQLNAVHGGEINLQNDPDAAAMLLPFEPIAPVQRGQFSDFEHPFRYGLLPEAVDDTVTNRGPYDTIFGWRRPRHARTGGTPGSRPISYGGAVPIGRGGGGGGGRPGPVESYRVYGPLTRMREQMVGLNNNMRHSRFASHFGAQLNYKVQTLWGTAAPATTTRPRWIIDLDQATAMGSANASRIQQTRFVAVEIKSRYPLAPGQRPVDGSWAHVQTGSRSRDRSPRTIHANGWVNPTRWNVPKVNADIWMDAWTYTVASDPELGIQPEVNPATGEPILHTVYRYDHFMFAGVNVGNESVPIHNPNNFPNRDDLPAPTDLIHERLRHDDLDARRAYLTFMAVAQRSAEPTLWPDHFSGGAAAPGMVAVAQAHVFNDHSWDLWTQMWQPQMQEITPASYSQWVTQIEQTQTLPPMLSPQRVARLEDYLRSVDPLAQVMLSH